MRTLWQIPYSPWSTRARWALDHHGLRYQERDYRIGIDELELRFRLKKARGPVSVPVLFDGARATEGSFDIGLAAEEVGEGEHLFFNEAACRHWNALGDEAAEIGRDRGVRNMLRDGAAQRESLKGVVPALFRPALQPVARVVMRRLLKKYDTSPEQRFVVVLEGLRRGLDGGQYLVGQRLSYADLTMASVLDFVRPLKLRGRGPAVTAAWGAPELEARFDDLLRWRDALVAGLRPKTGYAR